MSFSVKGGGSPPFAPQTYVSPQMLPQSTSRTAALSQFSLVEDGSNSHGSGGGGCGGASSGGGGTSGRRSGTDPTKYKTTICRNWEQTGSCSFRGCTFAHGVDELRQPSRIQRSPIIAPAVSQSPSSTPKIGPGSGMRLEQMVEGLFAEVQRERDLLVVHVEANRTLEAMLRREQVLHEETRQQLEELRQQVLLLSHEVVRRDEELHHLLESLPMGGTDAQRERVEALAQWTRTVTTGLPLGTNPNSCPSAQVNPRQPPAPGTNARLGRRHHPALLPSEISGADGSIDPTPSNGASDTWPTGKADWAENFLTEALPNAMTETVADNEVQTEDKIKELLKALQQTA